MRHPGPPGYVHPCAPSPIAATIGEVLAALAEGMCPVCHSGLEPLPSFDEQRCGACHGCCPCTLWTWRNGAGQGSIGRSRWHLSDIPEGAHC